eukprot:GHRQ01039703.1.p1 GENE.GHRQ01039703.1~~GHRQ01039703.1.p1  ORF type:complete len:142 (-),score=40.82 GHRQ01039703.1:170-532(-)
MSNAAVLVCKVPMYKQKAPADWPKLAQKCMCIKSILPGPSPATTWLRHPQVLMAAQQALEVLMVVMPPLHCADILAHKLPSDGAVASGTAVDGEVLCATIRCLQVWGMCGWLGKAAGLFI